MKYDEWRQATDVIDIPEEFVSTCPAATKFFYAQLSVSIQEHLHIHRKTDNSVSVQIPIQKDKRGGGGGRVPPSPPPPRFAPMPPIGVSWQTSPHPTKKGWASCGDLTNLLGEKWQYRIVNKNKDFAFVVEDTITFQVKERSPMVEYNEAGKCTYSHRGFVLDFRFVRERGNANDLQMYLTSNSMKS